jgi:23S rRNA pseudouridine1911/1915/1917 synthase
LYVAGGGIAGTEALPGEGGYWLHAWRLALDHPATRRRLELECAPPPALR